MFKTRTKLLLRIRELEAEVERLRPFEQTLVNHKRIKKEHQDRRRGLLLHVGYRNWYRVSNRSLWPEVTCCECVHGKSDGSKSEPKWKCAVLGIRVTKYGSCNWADRKGKA